MQKFYTGKILKLFIIVSCYEENQFTDSDASNKILNKNILVMLKPKKNTNERERKKGGCSLDIYISHCNFVLKTDRLVQTT